MLPDEAWLLVGMAFGAETMSVPIVDCAARSGLRRARAAFLIAFACHKSL